MKDELDKCVTDFLGEAEHILSRVKEYDAENVIIGIRKNVKLTFEDRMFSFDNSTSKDLLDKLAGFFYELCGGKIFEGIGNIVAHSQKQANLKREIDKISARFDPDSYLRPIIDRKDEIIDMVEEKFMDNFLHPLQKQLEKIREKSMDKEQTLKEAKEKLVILKQKRQEIEVQLQEIM